jgi:hypothetical protein
METSWVVERRESEMIPGVEGEFLLWPWRWVSEKQ